MVQAHTAELLNQKESKNAASSAYPASDALFAASERLLSALEQLERGVEMRTAKPASGPREQEQLQFITDENQLLARERDHLNLAIDQLKAEYGDLHRTASTIYNKLDDSIKRLTQIVEK